MDIITLCLGELGTNCYIVATNQKNAILIDPACNADEIIEALNSKGLKLEKILITHGHFDHIMAGADIAEKFQAPVYVHTNDRLKLTNTAENLHAHFSISEPFKQISNAIAVNENDEIIQDELTFKVLHTPGHTMGSVCYICEDVIFSGDTLFEGSIGRTDMPNGSYPTMVESLQKLSGLEGDYRIYPGHGNITSLNYERQHNIFLTDIDQI